MDRVKAIYRESLAEKTVKPGLAVEIKNLMENLRSALDYAAAGLFAKYGKSEKANPRIYFPYALENQTADEFKRANRVEACIPGLSTARSDIVAQLESYQAFSNGANVWLPRFMDLNNENKHEKLTPQARRETKELRLTSGGASISIGQGASISIGKGASIQIGSLVIPGGQTFDVNKPPATVGPGKTEVVTWVSFDFASNGEAVIPFLRRSLEGIDRIVTELAAT